MAEYYDVAIVGGGPAGQAAALRTLSAGLSTCMIDEQQRPGGQILRQPPAQFGREGWMTGALYRDLRKQLDEIEREPTLVWIGGTSVLTVSQEDDGFILVLSGEGSCELRARRVLIAAGCYDMPVALPGWTLPGVMTVGAVQTLLKAQGVLPGQRFALFGTHPLMIVLAEQLVDSGAEVAALIFAQSRAEMIRRALPHLPAASATPAPLLAAFKSWRKLRAAGVEIVWSGHVSRIVGEDSRVTGVEIVRRGEPGFVHCDIAAMCYGFLPQADLPRTIGAQVAWSPPAGGWETREDGWMRSTVRGVYVAGETTGVTGADAAMVEGTIAGLAIACDAGVVDQRSALREHGELAARRRRLNGFIALLRAVADPHGALPEPDPETLLCRCEDISADVVDNAIGDALSLGDGFGASAIKLRSRAGMGLCQGRSCEHTLVRRIAAAQGRDPGGVSGFRTRFPVRPVTVGELIDGDIFGGSN